MTDETISEKLKSFKEGWEACNEYSLRSPQKNNVYVELIESIIHAYYGLTFKDLAVKSRPTSIVFPRQLAMYFLRTHTFKTLKEVGEMFDRDHTTVINSMEVIRDYKHQIPFGRDIAYLQSCIREAIDYNTIEVEPAKWEKHTRKYKKALRAIIKQQDIKVIPVVRPSAEYSNNGNISLINKYSTPIREGR